MKKKNKSVQVDIKALRKLLQSVAQKTKPHATAVIALTAILMVAIFASNLQLQDYFKSQPSQASTNWQIERIQLTYPLVWEGKNFPEDISGNKILIKHSGVGQSEWSLLVYDLNNETWTSVAENIPSAGPLTEPIARMDGDKVVWEQGGNIYLADISQTPIQKLPLTSNGINNHPDIMTVANTYPNIWIGKVIVVWHCGSDICMDNATNPQHIVLNQNLTNDSANQDYPRIEGKRVVWQDDKNKTTKGVDVYLYNMNLGYPAPQLVTNNPANQVVDQVRPDIYGNNIVWQDYRNWTPQNKNTDIYTKDINNLSSADTLVTANDQSGYGNNIAALSRGKVVYTYGKSNSLNLFVSDLEDPAVKLPITTNSDVNLQNDYSPPIEDYSVGGHGFNIAWSGKEHACDSSSLYTCVDAWVAKVRDAVINPPTLLTPSSADYQFKFLLWHFSWTPVTGSTTPINYWMQFKLDNSNPTKIPLLGETSLDLPSDLIETALQDGGWWWRIAGETDGQYYWSSWGEVIKKTAAIGLLPLSSDPPVHSGDWLKWDPVAGAKNYVIRIYGGNIFCNPGLYCYVPLNTGGGDNSQYQLIPKIYDALASGQYHWSVAGTALGNNLSSNDLRLPKLYYGVPFADDKTFTKE